MGSSVRTAWTAGSRPRRWSAVARSSPVSRSMTMKGSPCSAIPKSKIRTIAGWVRRAAARASRRKRLPASGPSASLRRSLTATSMSSVSLCASQTSPMPPRPSTRSSRYLPATRCPDECRCSGPPGGAPGRRDAGAGVGASCSVSSPGKKVWAPDDRRTETADHLGYTSGASTPNRTVVGAAARRRHLPQPVSGGRTLVQQQRIAYYATPWRNATTRLPRSRRRAGWKPSPERPQARLPERPRAHW